VCANFAPYPPVLTASLQVISSICFSFEGSLRPFSTSSFPLYKPLFEPIEVGSLLIPSFGYDLLQGTILHFLTILPFLFSHDLSPPEETHLLFCLYLMQDVSVCLVLPQYNHKDSKDLVFSCSFQYWEGDPRPIFFGDSPNSFSPFFNTSAHLEAYLLNFYSERAYLYQSYSHAKVHHICPFH